METCDIPLDAWISIKLLAKVEYIDGGPTVVYKHIYNGNLRHSRRGRRILVRRCDWRAMHDATVVEATAKRSPGCGG